jgi:hypothetical protein
MRFQITSPPKMATSTATLTTKPRTLRFRVERTGPNDNPAMAKGTDECLPLVPRRVTDGLTPERSPPWTRTETTFCFACRMSAAVVACNDQAREVGSGHSPYLSIEVAELAAPPSYTTTGDPYLHDGAVSVTEYTGSRLSLQTADGHHIVLDADESGGAGLPAAPVGSALPAELSYQQRRDGLGWSADTHLVLRRAEGGPMLLASHLFARLPSS